MCIRDIPRIEPWGTPPYTGRGDDQLWPTFTCIMRFERNVATNSIMGVVAPSLARAARQFLKLEREREREKMTFVS